MVRYLEICDGNMEEGSLRCDANISVRKLGDSKLGTKVEVKNLNSIRNVKRAIEFEAGRLIGMLEKGETIIQQTRSFEAASGTSFPTREKEDADDYRYFPEPDLAPFHLDREYIHSVLETLPVLQADRIRRYMKEYSLSEYDAGVLTDERSFSDYFEQLNSRLPVYKANANWMLGPVRSWMNENNKEIEEFPISAARLSSLIGLVNEGKLSFTIASTRLFNQVLANPESDPMALAEAGNMMQQSDSSELEPVVDRVLEKLTDKVNEYRKGKKGLLALFVGEVMKQTKGKADPRVTNELLLKKLKP